jgi:DNA-binding MarR family transcriptional regulator/GNAT superfamily N-acetyltransferase
MDDRQIEEVRSFNRRATLAARVLDDSYLQRRRPLAEARLLFEIGLHGADVRELRARLGLDSGYLSRLLRSLEAQGLARVGKPEQDGRMRRVLLTRKGRAEKKEYDRLSDDLARSILTRLDPPQRERLVAAMSEVERLMRSAAIEVALEPPSSADARWCLSEYFKELSMRFDAGFDPSRKGAGLTEDEMTPPGGYLFLARFDGRPVGCGALRRVEAIGEIKRMWTAPSARGIGVARKLLRTLELTAREQGLVSLRLDTNRALPEAHALYRGEGFVEIAPFNEQPYAHFWFEKKLLQKQRATPKKSARSTRRATPPWSD